MSTTNLQSAPVFSKICFRQLVEYSFAKNFEDKLALIDNEELNICNNIEVDFIALLFCTHGNIELDINNEHYFMGTNDMFYCSYGTLLQHVSFSTGCRVKALCVSVEYAKRLFMRSNCCWENVVYAKHYPLIYLRPNEQQLVRAYYQLFTAKVNSYGFAPSKNDMDCFFQSFFQDFNQLLIHYTKDKKQNKKDISYRQDELFKQFMILLKENFKQEHALSFYADKLCVSSKYLSTIVKMATGQSVLKWIDVYLIDEIKSLLRNSNLNIKEIACLLNFTNPSFFGKYVKRLTGKSPVTLRKSLLSIEDV